jgi:hypothetical protein
MKSPKALAAAVCVIATLMVTALPAAAHDPIFLNDDQTTPDTGPYMPDGTISWALYGSVLDVGDTRGFEFDLRADEELYVSLLIPNLEPELSLTDAELPTVELETPSGEVMMIDADMRETFDEPFSNTSYVTLAEIRQPSEAGRYRGLVIGNAATRFTVAIGEREIFFTETERSGDRPASFPEMAGPLNVWYSTPAGETPADATDGEAEIQMDLIEEAMESGEAEAPAEAAADTTADDNPADEDDSGDEAAAAATDDDGNGLNLVAPLVLLAAIVAGGLFFLQRRRGQTDQTEAAG